MIAFLTRMSKRDGSTMKNSKREMHDDLVLDTLHQNWESAVSMGLRRLSDDELLRLLSEVNAHVDDADDTLDNVFAEAPDWDDRTATELEVIAGQFDLRIGSGTSSSAAPVRAPLRRRHATSPVPLTFEELESRYSPTTFTVMSHGRAEFAPSNPGRWVMAEARVAAHAWYTPATPSAVVHDGVLDHLSMDFDAEALSHMALAQVA